MKTTVLRMVALLCAIGMLCVSFGGCRSKKDIEDSSSESYAYSSDAPSESKEDSVSGSSEVNSVVDGTVSATTSSGTSNKKDGPLYSGLSGTTVSIPLFAEPSELEKKQIKNFEQKYGAKIKYSIYGWQEYQTRILVMVNSGTAPDITPVFDQQYLTYVGKNVIQPITEYIDPNDKVWSKRLNDMYAWGNVQYTVSTEQDLGVFGIYYNKDLFEEYGVDEPYTLYKKGQWNFENFRRVAKEMTVYKDGSPEITGFYCWKWDILCLANGGTGIRLNSNKTIDITLQEQRELTAFQLIQNMQITDKSYNYAYQSADNYFKAGRIAMISERPGYSSVYFKGKFKVGWAPLPKGPDVSGEIAPCIIGAWAVPRGAKNPEGGVAWIYSKAAYIQNNPNDSLVKKNEEANWPDATLKTQYDEYIKKAALHTSFIGGCNNWDKSTRWNFWEEILVKNTSPATAVEKHKQELQYEINQICK